MSGKYGTSNAGAEFVGVSDCNKLSILAKVKDLSVNFRASKTYGLLRDSMMFGLEMLGDLGFGLEFDLYGSKLKATRLQRGAQEIDRWRSIPSLNLWKGRKQRFPKNVNNDSVSPSSRVLREEDVRGVESDLVDSFEEGEIRDDSVLYNDGCIKDCMEKNLEDDAGEILGVHSQGHCGNVTTDDNEDVWLY
ncbi:hypothetical protein Tco_1110092 [Tanacetum coccineum]|uniref:Uncharacterized protein n=1 Tax=Tanacetum coccineum TaxID=301880 RepID=A0ABQ5IHV7_9ASTR